MGSEIVAPTLREKEWAIRRDRIGAAVLDMAGFMVKRTIDILPDLYAIKVKKLYELGGYRSFKELCEKCVGITPQHYYRMIAEHPEACKVLEINTDSSHNVTFGALEESAPETPKAEQKTTVEPPKEKKGRKPRREPEPVDATFTEASAPLRTSPPSITDTARLEFLWRRGFITLGDESLDGLRATVDAHIKSACESMDHLPPEADPKTAVPCPCCGEPISPEGLAFLLEEETAEPVASE